MSPIFWWGILIVSFVLKRVLQSIIVLFVMSLLVFFMIHIVGDPVDMLVNPESLPDEIEEYAVTLVWINLLTFNTGSS